MSIKRFFRGWMPVFLATITCVWGWQPLRAAGTEIVLWHSYRGAEKAALLKNVAAYNASQTKIHVSTLQVPHDAYPDKITNAIPRGKGPDIFIFAHDRIGDWAIREVIQPVGFWVDDDLRERYLPLTLRALEYDGELYGLPTAYKCTALFYNTDLVKTPPKTTDEMIEIARRCTNPKEKRFGLVYENGLTYYNALWIYGFGGHLFDSKRNPTLSLKENAEALAFARDLLKKHRIMPEEVSNSLVTSLFNEGRAAMVISGPWFRGEILPSVHYGVATLPVISSKNRPATPFLTVEGFLMSARTEHPVEAFEVMKALTSVKAAVTMAAEGKQPVAVKQAYEDASVKSDPWIHVFRKQLQHTVAMPNFPEMRMIWTPMDIAISKIITKDVPPETALKEAQEKILKDIALFRQ